MLISTKTKNEKIVLGLLSYTYFDGPPSIQEQKELIEYYRNKDDHDLYLYKDPESDNYVGIIGIERHSTEDINTVIIHRMAVIPSFRDEGIGYQMYCAIRSQYPDATIIGSMQTADLITYLTHRYNEDHSKD